MLDSENDSLFGLLQYDENRIMKNNAESETEESDDTIRLKNTLMIMPDKYANIARFFNGLNENELNSKKGIGKKKENLKTVRLSVVVTNDPERK